MPKNKKKAESSSSDSDEGPIDRNTPPEKKSKKGLDAPPEKKAKMGSQTDDAEPTWVLAHNKLVKLRTFKGKCYIDIREHYEKNGTLLPGKKGISLNPEMWRKLVSLSDDITEALSNSC
ncbi:hypothetical protein O0L34_g11208 [Tuta absoluta]|nr:hypothetical protein O0L34_g11208 [Tuta absoluta]